MTTLLQEAFDKVSQLPEVEQNAFAEWIMAELEAEHRWNELFSRSHDLLEQLAAEALQEHTSGRTLPLDPETL